MFISMLIVLLVCFGTVMEVNIFYKGFHSEPKKADTVIVLGCAVWGSVQSPALYERTYKAFELYRDGYARKIIASGGRGHGENITEAEAIKKQLIRLGVKKGDIIKEEFSTNTRENLLFSKKIMKKEKLESCIVVTNYYHIYRASLIAKDLKMNASFARAKMPNSIPFMLSSNLKEPLSLLKYFFFKP